ncbi:MAG: transporter substrate-binding domain-containing protein, partial [Pygmaiobacter massiliensis]
MKKLLTAALAMAIALSLVACGGSASSAPAASAPASSTPTSSAAASAEESLVEKIKAKGKLVVGTEAQYAPFEFKDEKAQFAGCDIWLAQQIADELGVKLEVTDMAFDGIIPAVKSGQVDIGIAAFTVTPERAEEIDFSNVYQRDEQMLIVQKGKEDTYTTKESLAGQKIGAQKGTVQSLLIKSALHDSELFELEIYPALAREVAN